MIRFNNEYYSTFPFPFIDEVNDTIEKKCFLRWWGFRNPTTRYVVPVNLHQKKALIQDGRRCWTGVCANFYTFAIFLIWPFKDPGPKEMEHKLIFQVNMLFPQPTGIWYHIPTSYRHPTPTFDESTVSDRIVNMESSTDMLLHEKCRSFTYKVSTLKKRLNRWNVKQYWR